MLKIAELTIQVRVSLVGGDGAGPDYGRAGHKDLIDEEHPHEHGGKAEGPYRSCDSHCERRRHVDGGGYDRNRTDAAQLAVEHR